MTMKQVLQNLRSGETTVVDVPVPKPKRGQALVQNSVSLVSAGTERMLVEFAGKSIFGKARSRPDLVKQVLDKARREGILTTLEAALNRLDQPMPLGYSSSGRIVELGADMSGFKIGQRVACSGGGYAVHAEYVTVPSNLLTPLPDNVSMDEASFATLGAIALHGFRLSDVQIGSNVAIIGLGLLGLLASGIAKSAGCHVLGIDLDKTRVEIAEKIGIQAYLRDGVAETALSFTAGRGFDAILVCADTKSADPVELAGQIARDRARVIAVGAVGLGLPRKVYFEKELTFINSRSYGPGRYDPTYEEKGQDYPIGYVRWTEGRNLEAFINLLSAGNLNVTPLITHRFPIEHATQAYSLISNKENEHFLGVMLTYQENMREFDAAIDDSMRVVYRGSSIASETKTQAINLGVIGAGNFAQAVMLPAVRRLRNVELIGIASASGASAIHAAKRYGFRYGCSDDDRIIHDPNIDTVAVLTRHNMHSDQVVKALLANKNVFCEKPLALNDEQLTAIEAALYAVTKKANESGINVLSAPLLTVGFNRRFAPFTLRVHDFFANRNEPLVAHYRVNAGFIPRTHWTQDAEIGGGRIIGEGCHFLDFLTFLVGEPPISVIAQALPDVGRYKDDNVVMTFTFSDGSIGTVSYLANGDKSFSKERVEVFCAGRVAVLDDFRTLQMVVGGHRKVYHSRLRQDKGHMGLWLAFRNAILNGTGAPIPYEHLFGVTRSTFAGIHALRDGDRVLIRSGYK